LESIQSSFEKADTRSSTLAKQTSTLEAQLTEQQENLREETRQKLAALARLRQIEEEAAASRDQLEEEEENRKQLEAKIATLNVQVNCEGAAHYSF
jgi:ABC-type enterochelin transport system substrate-binding protein